jgi:hypothetical protein
MLNLLGRTGAERAKSLAIGILAGLLLFSLLQISVQRADAQRETRNRQAVADVARRFAVALTTYDYAHPGVQLLAIATVGSPAVSARVMAASSDLASAKASSIGEVTGSTVKTFSGSSAEVLVGTSQVVSGTYAPSGTRLVGLLDVTIGSPRQTWVATDYSWLQAPSGTP